MIDRNVAVAGYRGNHQFSIDQPLRKVNVVRDHSPVRPMRWMGDTASNLTLSAAFDSSPHHRQETGDQQNGTVRSTCMYSSPAVCNARALQKRPHSYQ